MLFLEYVAKKKNGSLAANGPPGGSLDTTGVVVHVPDFHVRSVESVS